MSRRRQTRNPLGLILGFLALSGLAACGGGGGGEALGGGSGVVVAVPLPQIASFSAQPTTIAQGQSATLSWSVSGAASLSIDNGVGDVTGASSRSVSPAATTTYVLTASNATGSVTASAAVTVNPQGPPPTQSALQAARTYSASVGGQTFLVMHNGQIIDEAYANGGAADRVQLLASGTKGFTGLIGAIGAADGLYALDEPVSQRALPEWSADARKSQITFRHLLTMTSGLEELNDLAGWLDYLPARAINPPGDVFVYSGDPNIFGLALERRLGGERVLDYFNRKLFTPLDMASVRWGTNFADGRPQLSGGAYATARDWAKFGEFVRRTLDGSWTGAALLPRSVFDQVLQGTRAHPAYGFYWWLKEPVPAALAATIDANNKNQFTRQIKPIIDEPLVPDDFVMLAGAYGQRVYVIPSRGLTVVRNGPVNENRFDDRELLTRLLAPP